MTFSLFPKRPQSCAWLSARSTIIDGRELARSFDATEGASSIVAAISWHGRRSARPEWRQRKRNVARRRRAVLAAAVLALLALGSDANAPRLLWNPSPSIPTGLYMLAERAPAKGQLAIIRLTEAARALAHTRGYLPRHALLIKPVAAAAGDTVCRHGSLVTINGRLRAIAVRKDAQLRLLRRWHGCRHLAPSELFVLSTVPGSFDGRYLGPIERGDVLGTAVPIWTR